MTTPTPLTSLLQQRQQAAALLGRIDAQLEELQGPATDVEDALFETASRRGEPSFKPLRTSPRQEPVGAAPQTRGLFQRFVSPILRRLGLGFISGSGTFSVEELADAEYCVYFYTESGFFAEMRFSPHGRPFYSPITRLEAAQLRTEEPPPELVARLFTEIEPVDH